MWHSIEYIEEKANEILMKCGINCIPINPFEVADKLGVKILQGSFRDGNISGFIHKEGSDTEIVVEMNHPMSRQRFTVAHELGHFVLHMNDDSEFITYLRNNELDFKESEANSFAAALLMPKNELTKHFVSLENSPTDFVIETLARMFLVSEQAMKIRLINLGLLNYGW